jgi:hypothetical protein
MKKGMFMMPRFFVCLLVMLTLPMVAAAQGAPDQINIALNRLSAEVGRTVAINNLEDWRWAQDLYPDLSLGCPQPDTAYAQVATQGYKFLLTYGGVIYDYRVSADGNVAILCSQVGEGESAAATPTPANADTIDTSVGCPNPEPGVVYLPQRLTTGIQARVVDGPPIVQRSEPSDTGAVSGEIPAQAVVNIATGPVCADGQVWWQVDYDGRIGWAVEGRDGNYWLEMIPALALPANLAALTAENATQIAELSRVESNVIPGLAAAPDTNTVAVLGGVGTNGVWLYDLAALDTAPRLLRGTVQFTDVNYGADASVLLLGDARGGIRLWSTDPQTTLLERWFDQGYETLTSAVALAPDAQSAASAGDVAITGVEIEKSNAILLWNIEDVRQQFALGGHTGAVNALAFSPDGALLASASDDTTVRLWNPADGSEVATLEGHDAPVLALAFSPDGTQIVSADSNGAILLWDVASEESTALQESGAAVAALAFNTDGTLLASAGGDDVSQEYAINVWDLAAGESLIQLAGHTNVVGGLAFSGNALVSVSEDKTVRFWGVAG